MVWQSDWPGNIEWSRKTRSDALWIREVASFARLIMHDRRGIGLVEPQRGTPQPRDEGLRHADGHGCCRIGATDPGGVFESGAPNALLAASKPERVHSMVWMEPNPRFAWAPDYPWGRTPADMEAELRDIELWGTLAYGRAFRPGRGLSGQRVAGLR